MWRNENGTWITSGESWQSNSALERESEGVSNQWADGISVVQGGGDSAVLLLCMAAKAISNHNATRGGLFCGSTYRTAKERGNHGNHPRKRLAGGVAR